MGEYLLMLAVSIFVGGLLVVVYQALNHKFPKHNKTTT
ncbi:hypothetical protein MNB_SUP05-SYMBIONT-5-434 [hydrothermal vent metagenome]|uniref:Uncharacterized protein n=1 Tax=hydrothermal vent metagenome TaxID=652676 RepID=A0A1W1E0T9_9ZZZZ